VKVARHIVEARRESIASLVRQRGYLPIQVISQRFRISPATARRDLDELVSQRLLTRTHGGALSDFNRDFASLAERRTTETEAKRLIGLSAAAMVKSGMTLYIDAGTTPLAVAEAIASRPVSKLRVVTPSLSAAKALAAVPEIEVHLPGGLYLGRQEMLAGPQASKALRGWRFDLAFVGAEGINAKGIHNSQADIVAVTQTLLQLSGKVILCLTKSKVGMSGPVSVASTLKGFTLLTNATQADLVKASVPLSGAPCIFAR
jgi:DeoR/GlpR family transcriptional regulator of sugar metabolism